MSDHEEELLDYEGEDDEQQQQNELETAAGEHEEPVAEHPATAECEEPEPSTAGPLAADQQEVTDVQPPASAAAANGAGGPAGSVLLYTGPRIKCWGSGNSITAIRGLKPQLCGMLRGIQPGAAASVDGGLAAARGVLTFLRGNVAAPHGRMHHNLGRLLSTQGGHPCTWQLRGSSSALTTALTCHMLPGAAGPCLPGISRRTGTRTATGTCPSCWHTPAVQIGARCGTPGCRRTGSQAASPSSADAPP